MVALHKNGQPLFYRQYKSNRIIIDTRTNSTRLKGIVRSSSDGKPIYNVSISIPGNGHSLRTDLRGKFIFPKLIPGIYSLSLSHDGFQDLLVPEFELRKGSTLLKELRLQPRA